jgi:hypothetical protein
MGGVKKIRTLIMSTKKTAADGKKATTIVANDPDDLKGTLKNIGGPMSDHWNNLLANQTIQTLWLKHSDQETRDRQLSATVAAMVGIKPSWWQGPAEGHGGARPRAFRRSGSCGHGRDPGGRVSAEIRGTTLCNCLCTGPRNAEPVRGAVNRAKRQQCRTAAAVCTAERHQALRRAIRTPLSTGATRPRRLSGAGRFQGCCAR